MSVTAVLDPPLASAAGEAAVALGATAPTHFVSILLEAFPSCHAARHMPGGCSGHN